jgi:hypothetical protein
LVLALDAGNPKSYPATSAQLIINGTFDSNVTGWTTSNSTNTWSSGKMQITRSGGDGRVSYQTFTTITGQTYRVTAEVNSSGSRGDVYIYDGSGIGGTRFLDILGTNGQTLTLTGTFTAISTTTTLGFGVDANGTSIVVDNVSVSPLWTDISGRGNTGTLTNGPTYSSANGGSIVFDGVNDYVNCGNNSTLQLSQGTVSTWAKTLTPGSGFRSIIAKQFNYGLFTSDGILITYDWGNSAIRTTGINISDNSWKNICISFTDNTGTPSNNAVIYLNGTSVLTTTIKRNDSFNIQFEIGRGGTVPSGDTQYLNGNIAQVSIYNRALTAAEISQNFNATRGRFGI